MCFGETGSCLIPPSLGTDGNIRPFFWYHRLCRVIIFAGFLRQSPFFDAINNAKYHGPEALPS